MPSPSLCKKDHHTIRVLNQQSQGQGTLRALHVSPCCWSCLQDQFGERSGKTQGEGDLRSPESRGAERSGSPHELPRILSEPQIRFAIRKVLPFVLASYTSSDPPAKALPFPPHQSMTTVREWSPQENDTSTSPRIGTRPHLDGRSRPTTLYPQGMRLFRAGGREEMELR